MFTFNRCNTFTVDMNNVHKGMTGYANLPSDTFIIKIPVRQYVNTPLLSYLSESTEVLSEKVLKESKYKYLFCRKVSLVTDILLNMILLDCT